MKDWAKLFESYTGSRVYTIKDSMDLNELERAAVSQGLAFFKADLSKALNKEDFLDTISKTLNFPSYFGMNWDAFEECLNDLEWCNARGYVIALLAIEGFSSQAPDEFKTVHRIFSSAAKHWKSQKTPFYVILVS